MNQKQKISLMIKIGFFVVFFLIIALIVLLVTTLLTPAKDITHSENAVSDSPNTEQSQSPSANESTEPVSPNQWRSYEYEFTADLSAYEEYMNVEGDEYLFLVNTDQPPE